MCCAVTLHRQLRVDAVTAMRLVLRSASDHSRIPRVASSRFARLLFAAPSLLSLPLRFAPHQRFALQLVSRCSGWSARLCIIVVDGRYFIRA